MGPVKLKVSTYQSECFAGSAIEGNVMVEVCTVSGTKLTIDVSMQVVVFAY